MRVEHNGHWAELKDKPLTWGERNRLRSAASGDLYTDFAPALVTYAVTAWGEDGDCTNPKSWEAVDSEFGDAVFQKALNLWKERVDELSTDPTPQQSGS